MFRIEIYQNKNGKSEIEEYIIKLKNSENKEDRIKLNKIRAYMKLLMQNGLILNEPYIKKIDKEIWELRPTNDRIFFALLQDNKFILLNYFVKKTQKTPKKEIEKAHRLLNEYKKRSENYGTI